MLVGNRIKNREQRSVMSVKNAPILHLDQGVAVWSGGCPDADLDIWFLHALGDSHLCFRDAFVSPLSHGARIFLFDLPGHGASPPRPTGLTIEEAAHLWRDLIVSRSSARGIALVGHSIAGIIATRTAQMLNASPRLVISVEGNLTSADAYFSGQAARFEDPELFHASLLSQIREMTQRNDTLRRFACSLESTDPRTLWTLGRSVLSYATPGHDLLGLPCPHVYYWDPKSTTEESMAFLAKHVVRQRKLEGLGHWPMVTSPATFYAAVDEDLRRVHL